MSPEDRAKKNKNRDQPMNFPGWKTHSCMYVRSSVKLLTVLRGLVKGILFAHFPIKWHFMDESRHGPQFIPVTCYRGFGDEMHLPFSAPFDLTDDRRDCFQKPLELTLTHTRALHRETKKAPVCKATSGKQTQPLTLHGNTEITFNFLLFTPAPA